MKKSEINIEVELDENQVPEKLHWSAVDGGIERQESRAIFVSVWDEVNKEAMRIDLWTKEMPMDDMKIFFHQIISTMATTYERATSEQEVAMKMRAYAEEFAVDSGIREDKAK